MDFGKVIEYINLLQQYIRRLNILIFGKPLFDWLKLGLLYSFVVWFAIIGWNGYQFYKNYKKILTEEKYLHLKMQEKQRIIMRYKQKLRDIQIAYNEARKIFNAKSVNNLMKHVDTKIAIINKQLTNTLLKNSVNPYRVKTFNIRYYYLSSLNTLSSFSLKGIPFRSNILSLFKNSFKQTFEEWRQIQNKPYRAEADVSLIGKNVILYLHPSYNGYLSLKPVFWNGIVITPQRAYVFPTLSFYKNLSEKNLEISPLFFGWYLRLSNNSGGF